MITRDSHAWWFVMGGALIVAVSSRMDLIDPLLPAQHTKTVHALIELLAYLVGVGAGVARMSPLAISPQGRTEIMESKGEQMHQATVAAAEASVKADKAVVATSEAAKAAEVAKDESKKAGDL
jgi:hypothetical protein